MEQQSRRAVEELLDLMDASMREAGSQVERVESALGECDTAQLLLALREIAGLQTALGDLGLQVENLRRLLTGIGG